jgi:hypothetical protein
MENTGHLEEIQGDPGEIQDGRGRFVADIRRPYTGTSGGGTGRFEMRDTRRSIGNIERSGGNTG